MSKTKTDTRTDEEKAEARKRSLANLKPFKPLAELSEEERQKQYEITQRGFNNSAIAHHKRATMNELAKALLNQNVTREQAERILGEDAKLIAEDGLTVAQVLNVAMVQESLKGNVRAYEAVRDTAGYAPKTIIQAEVETISEADKQLLELVASRLNTQKAENQQGKS